MKRSQGFALAIFLAMVPVIATIAWTFLKFSSITRTQSIGHERQIRALQAAEAGIRLYIASGEAAHFEMNECEVNVTLQNASLISTAQSFRGVRPVVIKLDVDRGFVTRRSTNEES